jgi:hypothetical protein
LQARWLWNLMDSYLNAVFLNCRYGEQLHTKPAVLLLLLCVKRLLLPWLPTDISESLRRLHT